MTRRPKGRDEAGACRALGPPLAVQMLALLAGGLVVAQVVTVLVVLFAPQEPPRIFRLSEVVAALRGRTLESREGGLMVRELRDAPPERSGPPGRFDVRGQHELAALLGLPETRVILHIRRPSALADAGALRSRPLKDGPPDRLDPPPPNALRDAAFQAGRPLIGQFTAAFERPDGRWMVVEPTPDPFPSPWQRRVLLWFLGCMLALAPVAYLFARHITAPIRAFARAAERIGRDPTAPLIQLTGPAEIGTAARAMNEMQVRLKRYVHDRTITIAAISHDLRTPLARMRFKLEKAPPELKAALERDVDQMEQMVGAALEFIRQGAVPRTRDRLDLLSAVECVVDGAAATGATVELTHSEPVIVEADALGLERLFSNLVDNASKYGGQAQVTVRAEGGEGVVEISDRGPGLPAAELERVFQPFYRTEPSRNRGTGGMGLGLAVARSIARAHGGDVSLSMGEIGLVARVRLPLAPA